MAARVTSKMPPAKSFKRDNLEGIPNPCPIFIDLGSKEPRDIPSLSPLEGIFYTGISKTDPLFS
jgi:hypothetical protein